MPRVKGKEQLCVCDEYKNNFKSIQGLGKHTLFERFGDIDGILNKYVDEKYRHFLAQPVIVGDETIYWYSIPYYEPPRQLSELKDGDLNMYNRIKGETIEHYRQTIKSLENKGMASEALCLDNAIKFVNDDFVYCFDDKVVLGIWGMELRENVRKSIGIVMKNAAWKPKKRPDNSIDPPNPSEGGEEDVNSNLPDSSSPDNGESDEDEPNQFNVKFNSGTNGILNGVSELSKRSGEYVRSNEVPLVEPDEAYEFIGWDKNPVDYRVTEDVEFTARYREILTSRTGWAWLTGKGCLNWLLLLLLLALIFMVIWCCFLKQCNFNFCGCNCDNDTVVPPNNSGPVVSPCNAQVKSGGNEGYIGTFTMGQPSGSFVFEYNTYSLRDRIKIYEGEGVGGNVIFTYDGSTEAILDAVIEFNNPTLTIEIVGGGETTVWDFMINCPEK